MNNGNRLRSMHTRSSASSSNLSAIVFCSLPFLLIISLACKGPDRERMTEKQTKIAQIMMIEDSKTADPRLYTLEKDGDPEIRERVALAAGRVGDPILLGLLDDLARDPDPGVRETACFSLGIMEIYISPISGTTIVIKENKPQADILSRCLDDGDPQVRAAAADAIARLKYAPFASRLLEKLSDQDKSVIAKTLLVIWKLKNPSARGENEVWDSIMDRAVALSRNEDPDLRWKAAYCLMRLADPRSFARLEELSRDEAPLIRSLVARALGNINDPRAAGLLVNLCGDSDWKVAVEALRSVEKGKAISQDAIARLLESENKHIVLSALHAFPLLKGGDTEIIAKRFLNAREPFLRACAIDDSSKLPVDRFLPIVERMMQDPAWEVRASVADALGMIQSNLALPYIHTLINDADERVVPHALTALMQHHPADPIASLNHLFLKKDFVVRATAISEVSKILSDKDKKKKTINPTGEDLKDTFLELLRASYDIASTDSDPDAKLAILDAAAGMFEKSPAEELVRSALKDKEYIVRKRASEILGGKKGENRAEEILPAVAGRSIDFYRSAIASKRATGAVIRTERGNISIEFYPDIAPLTIKNFCDLAEKRFYDGKVFHRVVPGFVIQDGCPRGDGNGGPGYMIRCELNPIEYGEGAVGMALSGRDTGGSQFFITQSPQPHLTGNYTLFGRVSSGMDVVERILPDDKILSIEIVNER